MKIAVVGLWHLGMVTAACLAAEGHAVCALDRAEVIAEIHAGRLPVNEPGLAELVAEQTQAGRLTFATQPATAAGAELIWICYDTPIDDDDRPDTAWVLDRTAAFLAAYPGRAVVVISSQLPVGSIASLARACADERYSFACIPENLRLGSAIDYFRHPDRMVVGTLAPAARRVIEAALAPFVPSLIWMDVESAEVVKHAINAFLATSVVFANEIAAICERVGADARDVERGLKSDFRIGPKAYVRAGEAFAGGTLARDLAFLADIGTRADVALDQIPATTASNDRHRSWVYDQVAAGGPLTGRRIALLGLVYKPGTDTLRASSAVALARKLSAAGSLVTGYDPAIAVNDRRLDGVLQLMPTAQAALEHADLAVIATSWPQFGELAPAAFMQLTERTVIDEARIVEGNAGNVPGLRYIAFGRPATPIPIAR